jgi:hypothetical protein
MSGVARGGPLGPLSPVLLEKEDNMWIVYVVVVMVGLVFGILSIASLEREA